MSPVRLKLTSDQDVGFDLPKADVDFHVVVEVAEGEASPVGAWPPASLVEAYVEAAFRHRRGERMEDGRWFAEILALEGVWADGDTEVEAEQELFDVLHAWVDLRLERGKHIPPIDDVDINV